MSKSVYGVYDSKGRVRYIGATTKKDVASLNSQIVRQMEQAKVEIARGKHPNPREILFELLLKSGPLRIKFLTGPTPLWLLVKKRLIQRAKDSKIPIVNVAKGGEGSEGVHVKSDSLSKAAASRAKLTDEDAYKMHTLWRVEGWTQSRIAASYGITEKGAQKILSGYRRPHVLDVWKKAHPGFKKAI